MAIEIIAQPELGRGPRGGYKWKGEPLTRVTSIIGLIDKPALTYWAAGCACDFLAGVPNPEGDKWLLPPAWEAGRAYTDGEIAQATGEARKRFKEVSAVAADYGTAAHKWIQEYLEGKKPEMPTAAEVRSSITGFLEWESQHKVETVKTEWMIADPKHMVGGMLDYLASVDGDLAIVDFKTGKPANKQYYPDGLYPEQKIQVDAYHHIATPLVKGGKIKRRYILKIPKDGQPAEMTEVTTNPNKTYKAFIGLLRARNVLLAMGWKSY